jgi:hypothetical protein
MLVQLMPSNWPLEGRAAAAGPGAMIFQVVPFQV